LKNIEIQAKSLIRRYKKVDSWFISRYGMNPYRGCTHNCAYCDGRAEKYNVSGDFGKEVSVKTNAIQLLDKELSPKGKRKPLKKAYILPGGGVGDLYQPAEKKYEIGRRILQTIYKYNFPVHILTKSILVERDLSLLKKINEKSGAIVSSSFSSVNDEISKIFEPAVPSPRRRLKMLNKFKQEGIATGIFLLPVIPFITDAEKHIEDVLRSAKEIDVDFVIFGGMTLKPGKQKDYYLNVIKENYPSKLPDYENVYSENNEYGNANRDYYKKTNRLFVSASNKYKIPTRVPLRLFKNILDINDLTVVIFEHIDYFLKQKSKKSNFGYIAYQISQLKEPLPELINELHKLKGINKIHIDAVKEIIDKRSCGLYERLIQ
jgi:DNA repair photolyase